MPDGSLALSPYAPPEDALLRDTRAEQALLGALLGNSGLVRHVPASFSPEHYADPLHTEIHRLIAEIAQPGVPVGITVLQSIGADDPDNRKYVAGLLSSAVSYMPGAVQLYAEAVTDMHRRRGLCATATAMQRAAHAGREAMPAEAAIAIAMNQLDDLAATASTRPAISLNDAMDTALAKAEEIFAGKCTGISTGFGAIDETLGMLEPGMMFVLAGRPGMGKSALGMQIGLNVARSGVGVLAISLEMSAVEVGRRMLAACSGVPVAALKKGRHAPYASRLTAARRELHDLPLTIEDGSGLTAGMIALKTRAARRRLGKHGLGLIVIDHLHIVRPDDADARHGSTWAVGRVSGAIKRLAKENDCPVLVLAQLNRGVEGRDDKRPTLADLRHAGDIEQDADAVGFVYRPEYYMGNEPERTGTETTEKYMSRLSTWQQDRERLRGKAELIFAKVRDGAPDTVHLNFHGETTSFSESVA